eukprot:m.130394 g.130394  ORF g.130394 m.130394 type:complete len:206 (+) comp13712_c0_seq3:33-650(+)
MSSEPNVASRRTLAIDIDEVLCYFVEPLASFAKSNYDATVDIGDFFSYTFREVWKCDEVESTRRVQAFFESDSFQRGLPTVDGAREALSKLSTKYRLVAVTSRQTQIESITRAWIDREFSGLFDSVLFGNHWGLSGEKKTKPEMCLAESAVCLIDDSPKYVTQCAEVLDHVILFGSYPWNVVSDGSLPHNARRATSWTEVLQMLL